MHDWERDLLFLSIGWACEVETSLFVESTRFANSMLSGNPGHDVKPRFSFNVSLRRRLTKQEYAEHASSTHVEDAR